MLIWTKLTEYLLPKKGEQSISLATNDSTEHLLQSFNSNFERRSPYFSWNEKNSEISAKQLRLIAKKSVDQRLVFWDASISYSGRVREAALQCLISHFQTADENRIWLRLTDWVEPVAKLAEDWVNERLETFKWEDFKRNAPLLLFLMRADKPVVVQKVKPLIQKFFDICAVQSESEFYKLPQELRRTLYKIDLKNKQILRSKIINDPNPFARLLLLNVSDIDLTQSERVQFENSKIAALKVAFLRWRIRRNEKIQIDELEALAFSGSLITREMSGFYLKKLYAKDRYELTKLRADDSIFFLADFSNKQDKEVFLQGLNHTSCRIQLACLKALKKCQPDIITELPIATFVQKNSEARKLLSDWLPSHLSLDEFLALKNVYMQCGDKGYLSFFQTLKISSFWDALNFSLELLNRDDISKNVRDHLIRDLHRFPNQIFLGPRDEQLKQSISNHLNRLQKTYPYLQEQILFALNH